MGRFGWFLDKFKYMYQEIPGASVSSLGVMRRYRLMLEAIHYVIEVTCKSGLYLTSCLAYVLYFADFTGNAVDQIGATA